MIYQISEIEWEDGAEFFTTHTIEMPDDIIDHHDDEIVDIYIEAILEHATGVAPVDYFWESYSISSESAVQWMADSIEEAQEWAEAA